MGVEVEWRDMKRLVPASATLATFLGALVKNIRDFCVEHEDWLAAAGSAKKTGGRPADLLTNQTV